LSAPGGSTPQNEATAQEQAILAAISASTNYELVGDRLTLRFADGAAQILLLRPTTAPIRVDRCVAAPHFLSQSQIGSARGCGVIM
jgi:hypothetical protein